MTQLEINLVRLIFEVSVLYFILCAVKTNRNVFRNKVACQLPPTVANGRVVEETYPGTTVVEYDCLVGYRLIGSNQVTCDNGQWTQYPECVPGAGRSSYTISAISCLEKSYITTVVVM